MVLPPSSILESLPHRPPFRFLTSVSMLISETSGEAVWFVDGTEAFFAGHFPGRPIVPGLLIAEALAQLSGLIAYQPAAGVRASVAPPDPSLEEAKLAHADVRFKEAVVPPAEILLRSRMVLRSGAFCQFEVEARFAQHLVARGRLVLAGSTERTPCFHAGHEAT